MKKPKKINCAKCPDMKFCCQTGAWVDLEEAKKILELKLPGKFYEFKKDRDYPSGYRIGTSVGYNACSFLTTDGLCSIHIADYSRKPSQCIEFPYEKGKLAPFTGELCLLALEKKKKPNNKKKR